MEDAMRQRLMELRAKFFEPPKAQVTTPETPGSVVFDTLAHSVAMLYGRWLDEREYESWDEYIAALRKMVEGAGAKFVSAAKRPFGTTYEIDGKTYVITANSRGVGYRRTA